MLRLGRLLTAPWTTLVFILFCAVDLNELAIVVRPKSQCAAVGETVQFNCSTNIASKNPIEWKHRRSSAPSESEMVDIYLDGVLDGKYLGRYKVSVLNEPGAYNLIIDNVTIDDAGTFRCSEKASSEAEFKEALLLVKGRNRRQTEGQPTDTPTTVPLTETNQLEQREGQEEQGQEI